MQLTRVLAAAPLASLLLILGCSKTEDVAPERKLFGDPPKILNFRILNPPDLTEATSPQLTPATVLCDFSEIIEIRLCSFGFPGRKATDPIMVGGTYTQVVFEALVDDPDTVRDEQGRITQNNILLVASSFVLPVDKNEITLVLFDDGSANKFPQPGVVQGVGTDCKIDESGNCKCDGAIFQVDSNDPTRDDGIYTRGFAFVNNSISPYLQECIMREKRQATFFAPVGTSFSFRIDAVDRQGNLVTWAKEAQITVGQDSFSCTGDPCGCCILTSSDPFSECAGKPGMEDADGFELCKNPPF